MDLVRRMAQAPLLVLQISFILLAMALLIKQALLLIIIQRWRFIQWRFLLLVWVAIEVTMAVVRMGSRGDAVRLLISFGVLYDRFVRPVRLKWVVVGGMMVVLGFLVQGHIRGYLTLHQMTLSNVLTTNNEFQNLFGTAFDLYQRKKLGTLGVIPWQIYVSDAYILIPQQVLPFEKIDPASWYLGILGWRGTDTGLMFV